MVAALREQHESKLEKLKSKVIREQEHFEKNGVKKLKKKSFQIRKLNQEEHKTKETKWIDALEKTEDAKEGM